MTPVVWLILLSILEIKGFWAAKSISSIQARAREYEQGKGLAEAPGPSRVWPAGDRPTMSPCCWGALPGSSWLCAGGTWRRATGAARDRAPAVTSPGLTPRRRLPNPACCHPGCSQPYAKHRCHVPGALECRALPGAVCWGHSGHGEGLKRSRCCC